MVRDRLATFEQPAWLLAGGTALGYLAILAVVFLALFVLPWLVFTAV